MTEIEGIGFGGDTVAQEELALPGIRANGFFQQAVVPSDAMERPARDHQRVLDVLARQIALIKQDEPELLSTSFELENVLLIRLAFFRAKADIGNYHHVTRKENAEFFACGLQVGISRIVPNGVGQETEVGGEAGNAIALFDNILPGHQPTPWIAF